MDYRSIKDNLEKVRRHLDDTVIPLVVDVRHAFAKNVLGRKDTYDVSLVFESLLPIPKYSKHTGSLQTLFYYEHLMKILLSALNLIINTHQDPKYPEEVASKLNSLKILLQGFLRIYGDMLKRITKRNINEKTHFDEDRLNQITKVFLQYSKEHVFLHGKKGDPITALRNFVILRDFQKTLQSLTSEIQFLEHLVHHEE